MAPTTGTTGFKGERNGGLNIAGCQQWNNMRNHLMPVSVQKGTLNCADRSDGGCTGAGIGRCISRPKDETRGFSLKTVGAQTFGLVNTACV